MVNHENSYSPSKKGGMPPHGSAQPGHCLCDVRYSRAVGIIQWGETGEIGTIAHCDCWAFGVVISDTTCMFM